MKKILATLLLLILSTVAVMGQPGRGGVTTGSISSAARSLVTGATLPVTCTVGDVYYKTGAGAGSYNCTATNTWALITAPSAPIGASYVTNVAEAGLTGEQALSLLSSGIMRVNTTTGVISSLTDSAGIANNISDEVGSGKLVLDTSPTIATPIFSTSGTFGLAAADDPIIIDPVAKGGASKTLTITSVDLTDNRIATFQNVTGTVYVSGGTDVPVTDGGLGLSAVAVGEIPYGSGVNTYTALPADTSDIRKFLRELSIVGVAQIPGWDTVTKTDVGLSNVENTALSTWAGTINIVNLGAFTAGAPVTLGDSATYDPIIVSPAVKGAASKTLTISTNDLTDNRQATFQDVTGTVYVSGGTDVPVTDGGTGVSTLTTAYGLLAAGTTATGNVQTLAAGATTQILVGGGASALPAWGTDIPTAVTIGTAYIYRAGGTTIPTSVGGTGIATGSAPFTANGIFYASSTSAMANGSGLTWDANKLLVIAAANTKMTQGLTIAQGGNDDDILAFQSSDVNHGIAGLADASTYARFFKINADAGGLRVAGFRDTASAGQALMFNGYLDGTADTTKSTSGIGIVQIDAGIRSGTSSTSVGAGGNLATITNDGTTQFIFGAGGELWANTSLTTPTIYGGSAAAQVLTLSATSAGSPTEPYVQVLATGTSGSGTGVLRVTYPYAGTDTTYRYAQSWTSNEGVGSTWKLLLSSLGHATGASRFYAFQTSNEGVANTGNIVLQPAGGNVGIGTTAPGFKLEVKPASDTYSLSLLQSNSDVSGWLFKADTSANLIFARNSAGTPADYVTVSGITGNTTFAGTVNSTSAGNNSFNGNVGIGTPTVDTARLVAKSTTTQLALRYNEGAPNVETLFTTSSGGDLTIAPSGGDTSVTGTLTATSGLTIGASTANGIDIQSSSGSATLKLTPAGSQDVYTVATGQVIANDFAIANTTRSTIPLRITGGAAGGLIVILNGISVAAGGATTTGSIVHHTLDSASTGTAIIIDGSDIIRPLTSAERYKENIRRDWQTDTDAFFSLSPILFDYKNGGAKDVLSFSADQSMALPYLVNLNNDGLPESLREHAFISYLFNAAKADHARIIELEQQVKSLREHN